VIHLDVAFSEQSLDVGVRQAVAQIPTHRDHDDVRREAEPRERGPGRWRANRTTTHRHSLPEPVIRERNRSSPFAVAGNVLVLAVTSGSLTEGPPPCPDIGVEESDDGATGC
jgi:hypothetical protein